ncbi:MAG: DUF898 domain-containing protein [Burkholderiaceae bacterium]|jgi:uncharacterized membrane protein YjgN (DUF898 family)|nr:DUF898 domain-containing protein [Burkholderiaceae bacterium]
MKDADPSSPAFAGGPARPGSAIGHKVQFTGSGREYFRVWIASVFKPRADWHKQAQYFSSHTCVAGSPLEFTGTQRGMDRASRIHALLSLLSLLGLMLLFGKVTDELAGFLMTFIIFPVLLPQLVADKLRSWRSFSWRGVPLAFAATWQEVHIASWPVFVIAAIWAGGLALLRLRSPAFPYLGLSFYAAEFLVLTPLFMIRLAYNWARLLVTGTRIGGQAGCLNLRYGDFAKPWLLMLGVFLLVWALSTALGMALVGNLPPKVVRTPADVTRHALGLVAVVLSLMALLFLPTLVYVKTRMFQLTWNHIEFGQIAHTTTCLKTAAFVRLRLKHIFLTLLTLGLYHPFAAVSTYATKVNSVTLWVHGDIDQWAGQLAQHQGAPGAAAAGA